jgi:hypothetical protein
MTLLATARRGDSVASKLSPGSDSEKSPQAKPIALAAPAALLAARLFCFSAAGRAAQNP